MQEKRYTVLNSIIEIINYIGLAGINEIHGLDVGNSSIKASLESNSGEGYSYHYRDYTLKTSYHDNRELIISTNAIEYLSGNDYNYDTIISISYTSENGEEHSVDKVIIGWNYNNLLELSSRDFTKNEKDIFDNSSFDIKEILELIDLVELVDDNLKKAILKRNEDLAKVKDTLNSLSTEQIYALKKLLLKIK